MLTGDIVKSKSGYLFRFNLPSEDNFGRLALKDGVLDFVSGYELTDPILADGEEETEFDKAVDMAGLVYYECRYHSKPDEFDRQTIEKALAIPYTRWGEASDIADKCHGTYAKAVIERYAIECNHREEARAGLI